MMPVVVRPLGQALLAPAVLPLVVQSCPVTVPADTEVLLGARGLLPVEGGLLAPA